MANSASELEAMRRLLRQAGYKAGRPFTKARQFRLPLYGRAQVARFLPMVAEVGGGPPDKSLKRTRGRGARRGFGGSGSLASGGGAV